jgi:predicted RNase H-like HicB family nuclease
VLDTADLGVPEERAGARLRDLRAEVTSLRDELEEQREALQSTLAELEIVAVEGYLVKLWPGAEADVWIAHCPTVRCVAQESTRDEAMVAIRGAISEMLSVLAEMNVDPPTKDV